MVINFVLPFRYKTWTYGCVLAVGSMAEMIGYVGRILLHDNPWSNTGFEMQICTLILAPVSLSVSSRDLR